MSNDSKSLSCNLEYVLSCLSMQENCQASIAAETELAQQLEASIAALEVGMHHFPCIPANPEG